MMVFMLVPAVAPLAGSAVIAVAGWRGIFGSFLIFASLSSLWLGLRLAEPLPPGRRRPFRAAALAAAMREVLAIRTVRLSIAVQALCLTTLFSSISSIQQIVGDAFGRPGQFPCWFAMIALFAGAGSLVNAGLVMRLGMRRLVRIALGVQIGLSAAALALFLTGLPEGLQFPLYIGWQTTVFFQAALTLGNLNALAMEPLGHIAGMAASIIGGLATVGSVLLTVPVGLAYDGTPVPLLLGVLAAVSLGTLLMARLNRAEQFVA